MSPSPRWTSLSDAPLFQALAAAQHAAWRAESDRRRAVFSDTLRRLIGSDRADVHLMSALIMFDAQAEPPAGFTDPPANMHFECCPNCQRLNAKKYSQAPKGRVKLNALRDREWLARQLDAGRTPVMIAEQLGCCAASVLPWIDKHGLERTRHKTHDEDVAALHDAGLAPGEISRKLDMAVDNVRRALKRTRNVTQKDGHHYHTKEWWVTRLVTRQMTAGQCAADAGIYKHAASYWVKQFGLSEVTKSRSGAHTHRRYRIKYPALADPAQLQALMDKHGTYHGIAVEVCGKATAASNVRNWWKLHFGADAKPTKKHSPGVPVAHSGREWWVERLDRGLTVAQLAEEAGLVEKSALEKLRTLGGDLLGRGFRNNLAAEKAKRAPQRPDWIGRGAAEARSA